MRTLFICLLILYILIVLYIYNRINKNKNKKKHIVFSADLIPTLKILEDNWEIIAEEVKKLPKDVMITDKNREQQDWFEDEEFKKLVLLHDKQYGWIYSWQAGTDDINKKWINWGLIYDGKPLGKNAKMCPNTTKLLASIPQIRIAGFSLMKPNSRIEPHTDATGLKFNSLAYHLGLDIPSKGDASLIIGDLKIKEGNGKAFLFDATNEHYAYNNSDSDRIILYMDISLEKKLI